MNNSDPIKEEITVKLEMWRLPEDANARPAYDVAEEIISAMKVICQSGRFTHRVHVESKRASS
jgi:hypothetical protein